MPFDVAIARLSHGETGQRGPEDRPWLGPDNLVTRSSWGWDEDGGRLVLMLSEYHRDSTKTHRSPVLADSGQRLLRHVARFSCSSSARARASRKRSVSALEHPDG